VYQGQEQLYSGTGIPSNREALWLSGYQTDSELYTWISKLNKIRSRAISEDSRHVTYISQTIYSDDHTIAIRKGHSGYQLVSIFTNIGSSKSTTITLTSSATGFGPNEVLVDVIGCVLFTADSRGGLVVGLFNGLPRVLYPRSRLLRSGICPELTDTVTTKTEAPGTTISTATSSSTIGERACVNFGTNAGHD
jgi:alpha-amylase